MTDGNRNYTKKNVAQIVKYKIAHSINGGVSFFEHNLNRIGNIILALSPMAFTYVGMICYQDRGYFAYGGEVALYIAVPAIAFLLKAVAHENSKPLFIPVPVERFTSNEGDGEYSIRYDRLDELICYMAELEDWLEDENYTTR